QEAIGVVAALSRGLRHRLAKGGGNDSEFRAGAEQDRQRRSAKAQHLNTPVPRWRRSPRCSRNMLWINALNSFPQAGRRRAQPPNGRAGRLWLTELKRIWLTSRCRRRGSRALRYSVLSAS